MKNDNWKMIKMVNKKDEGKNELKKMRKNKF